MKNVRKVKEKAKVKEGNERNNAIEIDSSEDETWEKEDKMKKRGSEEKSVKEKE